MPIVESLLARPFALRLVPHSVGIVSQIMAEIESIAKSQRGMATAAQDIAKAIHKKLICRYSRI